MILAAFCFILVAMATAQPPQPCCLPETYSIIFTDLKEYGGSFTGYNELSADSPNMKMGVKTISMSGGTPQLLRRVVQDFGAKKIYIILPSGQCTVYPYDIPFNGNCIPKGATWLGSSYIGRTSTGDTMYDGWLFPLGQANVTIAVDKNCVPIVEKVRGMLGTTPVDDIYFFNGYQPGITDPSIFDIPSSCQQ